MSDPTPEAVRCYAQILDGSSLDLTVSGKDADRYAKGICKAEGLSPAIVPILADLIREGLITFRIKIVFDGKGGV